ncbi:MAG: SAM-dependent methyltransferase, partial [Pseudomonadota bacterium]
MPPLEAIIRAEIAATGPMSIARYMQLCLQHPEHGYYTRQDPLGASGDFTTAPEISQMFGEMLGLWAASVWQAQGLGPIHLIELGPGRGTLMADVLRTACALPGFADAIGQFLKAEREAVENDIEILTAYGPFKR